MTELHVLVVDPATLTPQQDQQIRILLMLSEAEALAAQAGRLTNPRRCILLRLRDSGRSDRLLRRSDALLAEVARLIGEDHTPLPPPLRFHLPGHPLAWWALQWTVGVCNAASLLRGIGSGNWALILVCAAALLAGALWRVPPYRLARQGKWHED